MHKDIHKTVVIFRVYKDSGDVIALFPELPGTSDRNICTIYEHVGQHGHADCHGYLMHREHTRPATPEEYANLARELNSLGYNLDIKQRISRAMDEKRWAAVRR